MVIITLSMIIASLGPASQQLGKTTTPNRTQQSFDFTLTYQPADLPDQPILILGHILHVDLYTHYHVTGLQQKRVYTSLGPSCPTCVHQSP